MFAHSEGNCIYSVTRLLSIFRWHLRFFICVVIVIFNADYAYAKISIPDCYSTVVFEDRPVYHWIQQRLKNNEIADLKTVMCSLEGCISAVNSIETQQAVASDLNYTEISSNFLAYLLANPEINSIRISGAVFPEMVCIKDRHIGKSVNLSNNQFKSDVVFRNSKFTYDLILDMSRFLSTVDLSGAMVGGSLSANGVVIEGNFNLRHAHISQDFTIESPRTEDTSDHILEHNSIINGEFIANSLSVDGDLTADFALFNNKVSMQFITVGENLSFRHGAKFSSRVDLNNANVKGRVSFSGASLNKLEMNSSLVGDSVILCNTKINGDPSINLLHASIGSDLDLRGARINGALLGRNLNVVGDIIFDYSDLENGPNNCDKYVPLIDSDPAEIQPEIRKLILNNAHVHMLQDRVRDRFYSDSSKRGLIGVLEIDGLMHDGFNDISSSISTRAIAPYLAWLEQDNTFTPQPYQRLASLLRENGSYDAANDVLFRSREIEKSQACDRGDIYNCVGLWALRIFVGYGIGLNGFIVAVWILFLTTLGAFIIKTSSAANERRLGIGWSLWASLDFMLPFITLDSAHANFISNDLSPSRKYLMYIQALCGWVLASFAVAAVAGLTQGAR